MFIFVFFSNFLNCNGDVFVFFTSPYTHFLVFQYALPMGLPKTSGESTIRL
jgi:hypothetical protein